MNKKFLFPPCGSGDRVILEDNESKYHLDMIQIIRNQVQSSEALLIVGELSGSQFKKIKAECHNLEQNYIKTRGLFFHRFAEKLVQDKDRYDEEKFPEEDEDTSEAGSEEGQPGEGSPVNPLGSDGGAEELLENGPEGERR